MSTVIKVENISKQYKLGSIGTNTLKGDLQRWWYKLRGLQDPTLTIGQENRLSDYQKEDEFIWALKNINFEVKEGEVLGIIGKNGAGKSTLLKLLSRVTAPTTGEIKIKGRIASLLEVGTGFHPELTGRENIFLNGAILGMTKNEIGTKFDEIVDFSGVTKYVDTPVKRYSSGMYVRLAFAVAAYLEPEILIVDEVLAVGDADFQRKAIGKMQNVSMNEGRTVIFVSHNMTAVKNLCKNAILLRNGEIDEIGKIDTVLNKYLSNTARNSKVIFKSNGENDYLKIFSIELLGNETGYFNIDDSIRIKIELFNKSIEDKLNINLFFKSIEGTLVFATVSEIVQVPLGKFTSICNVPPNFLNDNVYILDLMVVKNGEMQLLNLQDVILIEGIEPKRGTAWLDKFPGLIKPKFQWEFNF
jgi:lipopolysaccharide transport system ATP-binding protein